MPFSDRMSVYDISRHPPEQALWEVVELMYTMRCVDEIGMWSNPEGISIHCEEWLAAHKLFNKIAYKTPP